METRAKPKSDRTQFTAWISKYALTQGVFECPVEDCFETDLAMVKDLAEGSYAYYHGNDWHRTREGAVARASGVEVIEIKRP